MKGSMIIGQLQRLTLLLIIIFIVVCVFTTTTLSNPDPTSNKQGVGGLILKLIHRDLIYPPSKYEYDPLIAHVIAGLGSNLSKGENINQNSCQQKQKGDLKTQGSIFYVSFYIGTPGVRQFASLDTGSKYLWVQCAGYVKGQTTNNTIYNPHASRSYIRSFCRGRHSEPYCGIVSRNQCDEEFRCEYNIVYADGSHTKGHIGFETISFSPQGHRNRSASVSNVLFGCGMDNYNKNQIADGVFGIGGLLQLSIVGQTQRRFSFCIGSIIDTHNDFNHLALGNDARLEGVHVPYRLVGGSGFGVRLDDIRIGVITIPMPLNFIVIIDSGATFSHLQRSVYNIIKVKVDMIIGRKMVKKNSTMLPNALCYEMMHIWRGFPNVSIVSGGKTLLDLNIDGMFWRNPGENTLCLAIAEASNGHPNTLGAVAMQFHNVGFDLNSSKAYFNRPINCRPSGQFSPNHV